jgi:hypothetical protein
MSRVGRLAHVDAVARHEAADGGVRQPAQFGRWQSAAGQPGEQLLGQQVLAGDGQAVGQGRRQGGGVGAVADS